MTRERVPGWELALSLIASGEAPVHLGALTIRRDTAGPGSTGLVRLIVEAAESTPAQGAKAQLDDVREHVDELSASDARLQSLLFEYGYSCEIEANYGMGTVLLAGPAVEPPTRLINNRTHLPHSVRVGARICRHHAECREFARQPLGPRGLPRLGLCRVRPVRKERLDA